MTLASGTRLGPYEILSALGAGGWARSITTFLARRVSWSADGRSILAAVGDGDSDIVLLEGLTNVGRKEK